jgi:hypothetical protein
MNHDDMIHEDMFHAETFHADMFHADMAQNTAPQISTISTAAAASRSIADSRRIDGEIDAGGWPSPG